MDKIKFKKYLDPDYSDFKKLVFSLYSEDPGGEEINSSKIHKTVTEFVKFPEKGSIFIFIKNKITVGYAIIVNFWSNEFGGDILQIDEIYIKSKFRSQNIGTRFFHFLLQSKPMKVKAFGIEVTPSNMGALKLYQRLGFKQTENNHYILKL